MSTINVSEILSYLFAAGGVGYAIITHYLNKKKYNQEVKNEEIYADIKQDEFWKHRYDVLEKEVENKDTWWKNRYDALYEEYQREKQLSNEIVKSFRTELNEMRNEYEAQRTLEKQKYDNLMAQYKSFEDEIESREVEYKNRISTLEKLVESYELRLNRNESGIIKT